MTFFQTYEAYTAAVASAAVDLDSETDSNHDTALTLACAGGHEELVTLLINRGANIGKFFQIFFLLKRTYSKWQPSLYNFTSLESNTFRQKIQTAVETDKFTKVHQRIAMFDSVCN